MSAEFSRLQVRRTGSGRSSVSDSSVSAGHTWYREGGAICSIAVLLLGCALVIYGTALMTVGHKPLPEGQAEQWNRIARIKLHEYQQLSNTPEEGNFQDVATLAEPEQPPEPHAQHLAMMIKHAFESVISSEELPKLKSQTGSLEEFQLGKRDDSSTVPVVQDKPQSVARKLLMHTLN